MAMVTKLYYIVLDICVEQCNNITSFYIFQPLHFWKGGLVNLLVNHVHKHSQKPQSFQMYFHGDNNLDKN